MMESSVELSTSPTNFPCYFCGGDRIDCGCVGNTTYVIYRDRSEDSFCVTKPSRRRGQRKAHGFSWEY